MPAMTILSISCGCAVFVNVSQFMCLGRFSAVSFQVGMQPSENANFPFSLWQYERLPVQCEALPGRLLGPEPSMPPACPW